jgi:hypothetical protein
MQPTGMVMGTSTQIPQAPTVVRQLLQLRDIDNLVALLAKVHQILNALVRDKVVVFFQLITRNNGLRLF